MMTLSSKINGLLKENCTDFEQLQFENYSLKTIIIYE